jgi:hypothetical protein
MILFGCSKKDDRKLLFSCDGVMYLKSIDESFEPLSLSKSVPLKISFFVGEKEVEMNGTTYDICEGKNTIIRFGNCGKKENVHFHTFNLVTKKLYDYNYYSDDFRMKKNFPIMVDDIRGEYTCKRIDN